MRIFTNVSALLCLNTASKLNRQLSKALNRLSTGLRINSAADDAAGMAISEKMRAQTRGLDQAARNAQDGMSLLQTAEGGLQEIQSMLQRMRELSVQGANDTLTAEDRGHIQTEIDQLGEQIDAIARQTQFNRKKLLDGTQAALWSTSTRDIGVVLSGPLTSKDSLGNLQSLAGNYKVTFSVLREGQEQVQKSHILSLKHGTHENNAAGNWSGSGLTSMSALNLVEGVWGLETRETPFGGIWYYQGAAISTAAAIGASVQASPTPNILAPGSYDLRVSDRVPMMASFDHALTNGIVTGVDMSSRGAGSNFDAVLGIRADEGAIAAASQTYRNDLTGGKSITADGAGGNVAFTTRATNDVNLFTHFAVTATDRRDLMAGDVTLTESYVTHQAAQMTVNLDYRGTDDTSATVTYRTSSGGNTLTATSTWQAAAGATLTLDIGGGPVTLNIGGRNIEEIAADINASGLAGVSASVVTSGSTRRIDLTNASGSSLDVGETGVGGGGLGLVGTVADGATAAGAFRDYGRVTVLGVNGQTLADLASAVDGIAGLNASVVGSGTTAAQVSIAGDANYHVDLVSGGEIAGELALDHTFDGGGTHTSTARAHNYAVTAATAGQDLAGIAAALQNVGGTDLGVATTSAGALNGLSFTGASLYSVTLSGVTMGELRNGSFASTTFTVGRGAAVTTGNRVYVNRDVTVAVGDRDAGQIASALQTGIQTALAADGLTGNNAGATVASVGGGVTRQLQLGNLAVSGYRIALTGGTNNSLTEVWGGGVSTNRGTSATGTPNLDYGRTTTVTVAGDNIEQAFATLSGVHAGLQVTWSQQPDHTTPQHYGQIAFTNVSSGAGRRRLSMTQSGVDSGPGINANRKLFESTGSLWSTTENTGTHGVTSNILQAHDAVTLQVTANGNDANAAHVAAGGAVTLYEGTGAATETQNAGILNAALGHSVLDSFALRDDNPNAADFAVGESWMTYTRARAAGTSDRVDLTLYDGLYPDAGNNGGVTNGITYVFNDGALDGGSRSLHQLVRTGAGIGGSAALSHNLTFGTVNQDTSVSYGERAGAGAYWNDTAGTTPWYAQSYYGEDTTYFFGNGSTPASVVTAAELYRQNEVNASLMFEYDGTDLTVRAKGFRRDGSTLPASCDTTPEIVAASGDVTLFGEIHFTNLQIDRSRLTAGDKFVINVSAAALLDGVNGTPADPTAFQSTANIAVQGDPFRQNRPDWGSSAQYRLAQGVENGHTFNLLGYFVDPLNGSSDIPGLGYYEGSVILEGEAGGFAAGSTVGAPDGTEASAHRARLEINYQGDLRPSAGALVTSVFLQSMEAGGSKNIKDYVAGVGYSNYEYGTRTDGTYGPLNEFHSERYNPYNASLVFDVLEVYNGSLKFRIQGRVVDRDGNQWYVEDNDYRLNLGPNTSKNSSALPPVVPAEVLNPVVLFRNSAFGGLAFDEFTLSDKETWHEGDRFTLALTASGFVNGLSEAEQQADPALRPNTDEIDLFSDNRGTNMPHSFRFNEGILDHRKLDLGIYQLANNIAKPDSDHFHRDQVMDGTLSLAFGDYHPGGEPVLKDALTFEVLYQQGMDAGKAHYYSRAEDIAQFYGKNGRFLLENNTEQLTIRQGDREIHVPLGSLSEMGKLGEQISEQIWLHLLMQHDGVLRGEDDILPYGYNPDLMDEKDKREIFQFVNNVPGESGNEAVMATFLAHSVLPGEEGKLHFYGSEDLLKALGFATIQEAQDTEFRVRAADAHSGKQAGQGGNVLAGKRLYGLLGDNVALDIGSTLGLSRITFDHKRGTFDAGLKSSFDQFVHLADSTAQLQVGANEGEDLSPILGDVQVRALDVDNLDVRSQEAAARSITRLDNALDRVSTQRAAIGAQINRLEHTVPQLQTASANLNAARSRILDADMAREMMEFTKLNILMQANNMVTSQANQLPSQVLSLLNQR